MKVGLQYGKFLTKYITRLQQLRKVTGRSAKVSACYEYQDNKPTDQFSTCYFQLKGLVDLYTDFN